MVVSPESLFQDICRCHGKCPRAHWSCSATASCRAAPPHFSVTAPGRAPLNLGVKQLQKNLLGDIGVWHRPWGVWACWGPVAAASVMSPGVWGVTGRGRVGESPWVRMVLAGAEVFHLPQFLLIKRMNYSSGAASGICHPCPGHAGGAELCSRPAQGGFCGTPPGQLCLSSQLIPQCCPSPGPQCCSFLPLVTLPTCPQA